MRPDAKRYIQPDAGRWTPLGAPVAAFAMAVMKMRSDRNATSHPARLVHGIERVETRTSRSELDRAECESKANTKLLVVIKRLAKRRRL